MPADASIYGNVQTPQINIPNPMDMAAKSMQLSQLGMQQIQMAREMRNQGAIQDAYMRNTDPSTGQLDQAGVLSQLGKTAPMAAPQVAGQFAQQNKAQAEAKAAQLDTAQKTLSLTGPAFDYMAQMPESDRASAYPRVVQQLKEQGVDTSRMDHPYDPGLFTQYLSNWQNSKQGLENQVAKSTVAKNLAEAGPMGAAKLQGELYGSRSPNSTLSDEYNKQAQPIRNSQNAMAQMIDNYNNPSPQGYASLKLNAFKIKFPNAPDVNSLEELGKSQPLTDQMKAWLNQHAEGTDQGTMDNLMRDGISTFRANVGTLKGTQQRIQARQQFQGVNDPTLTAEPAIDQTYKDAMTIQKKIGPYVPPTQRGGIMGAVNGLISKVTGTGGEQNASAAQSQYRATGSKVSGDEVAQYATKHNMKLSEAQSFLKGQGYVIGR